MNEYRLYLTIIQDMKIILTEVTPNRKVILWKHNHYCHADLHKEQVITTNTAKNNNNNK